LASNILNRGVFIPELPAFAAKTYKTVAQRTAYAFLWEERLEAKLKRAAAIAIVVLCCAHGLFAQEFVFSARPEFTVTSGGAIDTSDESSLKGTPITKGTIAGGWAVEAGFIWSGGGVLTASVHSGIGVGDQENIGAFLNFGRLLLGSGGGAGWIFNLGYHQIPHHINVVENNVVIGRYTDYDHLVCGVALKLLFGNGTHNFDITPKISIGYRDARYVVDDKGVWRYYYDETFSGGKSTMMAAFSLGVGYTLIIGW